MPIKNVNMLMISWLSASILLMCDCNFMLSLVPAAFVSADDAAERHMNKRIYTYHHGKGKASYPYPSTQPRARAGTTTRPTISKTQRPSSMNTDQHPTPTSFPTYRKTHDPTETIAVTTNASSHPSDAPSHNSFHSNSPTHTSHIPTTDEAGMNITHEPSFSPSKFTGRDSDDNKNQYSSTKSPYYYHNASYSRPSVSPNLGISTSTEEPSASSSGDAPAPTPTSVLLTAPPTVSSSWTRRPTLAPSEPLALDRDPRISTTCKKNENGIFGRMSNDNVPLHFYYEVQYQYQYQHQNVHTSDVDMLEEKTEKPPLQEKKNYMNQLLPYVEDDILKTIVSDVFVHGCESSESEHTYGRRRIRRRQRRVRAREMEQQKMMHSRKEGVSDHHLSMIVGISSQPKDQIVPDASCTTMQAQGDGINGTITTMNCHLIEGRLILYYDYTSPSSQNHQRKSNDLDAIRQMTNRVMDLIRTSMTDGLMNDAHDDIVQVTFIEEDDDMGRGQVKKEEEESIPTNGGNDKEPDTATEDYFPIYAIYLIGAAGGGVLIAGCIGWMCSRRNETMDERHLYGSAYNGDKSDVLSSLHPSEEEEDTPFESSQKFDFGLLCAETIKTRNPWEGPSSMDEITLSDRDSNSKDYSPSHVSTTTEDQSSVEESKTVVFE